MHMTFLSMFWCCHCLLPSVIIYCGIWAPNSIGSLQLTRVKFSPGRHNLVVIKQNACIYIPATFPCALLTWIISYWYKDQSFISAAHRVRAWSPLHWMKWTVSAQIPILSLGCLPMERGGPQPCWVPATISPWGQQSGLHAHHEHGPVGQGW